MVIFSRTQVGGCLPATSRRLRDDDDVDDDEDDDDEEEDDDEGGLGDSVVATFRWG